MDSVLGHARVPMVKKTLKASSTVLASKEQIYSDLGDEVAILDLKAGTYYGLDAVGARVWNLVQEPRTIEEIREFVISEYEVEPERCERDLIALLQKLADEGLVEIRNATPA